MKKEELFEGVSLEGEEKNLFEELKEWDKEIKIIEKEWPIDFEKLVKARMEGGKVAFVLYSKLIGRGIEIKYDCWFESRIEQHKPEQLEFHQDTWPIDNLVQFVKCKSIFNRHGDVTLDVTFNFSIFVAHRNHFPGTGSGFLAPLSVCRKTFGWTSQYQDKIIERDDKKCSEFQNKMYMIDSISYPFNVGDYFEKLWNDAADGFLSQGDLKIKLERLFQWISDIEKAKLDYGLDYV